MIIEAFMMKNVEYLGQVFTGIETVETMISLIQNKGSILEPSCGNGAFLLPLLEKYSLDSDKILKEIQAIELDIQVAPKIRNVKNMDFFDLPLTYQYDTIIGNPPYVKYQNILNTTKEKLNSKLFDERTNLYLFFIEKSILHLKDKGELIFIVPRDFIKASSAIRLNKFIAEQGTITHWIDLGDKIIFPGFSPNCVIFRFEKGNLTQKTLIDNELYNFKEMNGQIIFTKNEYPIMFSDLFFVKVGGVSGLDEIFLHENGNKDFVYSKTLETGKTRKMFYNIEAPELNEYKSLLLKRKIKQFNEQNWYLWGRNYFESNKKRIYVNAKTRKKSPFFLHDSLAFDGSILAIFPKYDIEDEELKELCNLLNQVNWKELGFICDGRFLFSQRSLEQSFLPKEFKKHIKNEA